MKNLCFIEECTNPVIARDWCRKHYQRWKSTGDPLKTKNKRNFGKGELKKLLIIASQLDIDECLEIPGVNEKTRPNITINGKKIIAARFVWEQAYGDPGNLMVLHSCDNHICVNIKHLHLGNAQINGQEASERGLLPFGEKNHQSKLTVKDIPIIRLLLEQGIAQHKIATQFGVSQMAIQKIYSGKTWKNA